MSERIKITVIEEIDKERADGKESGWEETDRKETVTKENHRKETVLLHDVGKTLLYTLREGGIKLPSLCGSIGKCGRCQVKFRGQTPLPSQADRALIAPDKLREGYRLACMARPRKNCTVETAFAQEAEIHVVVGSS
ncbi:MAG: 2Fe-2S iron-sulfur cluster binding domain-containing protein, partial [Kineothrix sp.]|nr:2Fe-2S iron-sulfur cluster binding domain-containing protein [Kineothrix sp.]